MPASTPSALDQAEQLVAQGKLKQALDRLQSALGARTELYRDAVSLRSRLHTLNRQVTQGVIDREDENLERSRIVQGVLDLIEQAKSKPGDPAGVISAPPPTPGLSRRWVYGLIGVGLLVAITWAVRTFPPATAAEAAAGPPEVFALQVDLETPNADYPDFSGSGITAELGTLTLPLKSWQPGQTLTYSGVDAALLTDSLAIELNGWPYRYSVQTLEDRFAASTRRIRLRLVPQTETFSGVVTTTGRTPVAEAEMIFDGRFRTRTNARGHYEIELPLSPDRVMRIEIRRNGKVLEAERKIGQRAGILDSLLVHLPSS